jgi:hypothetical protein
MWNRGINTNFFKEADRRAVAHVPVEVRRVRIPRRTAAGFVIAILLFLVAAVVLSLSVYACRRG